MASFSQQIPAQPGSGSGSPFDLGDQAAYQRWRERKLRDYPQDPADLMVDIANASQLDSREHAAILERVRCANMAIYQCPAEQPVDKSVIRRLGVQFGLRRLDNNLCADEDGITTLRVVAEGRHRGYIPYTDRRLNWHTDGYYNPPERSIRAIVMHCVTPAAEGGENGLLDHEMAYLLMRDAEPRYIEALMGPDVMTIPPNIEAGKDLRGAQTGPVFSIDPATGALHMRYTARTRSIVWKDDPWVKEAAAFLSDLLNSDSPYVLRHRLRAGQGVISNNVLHCREAFTDVADAGASRILYRARYYDRIDDQTAPNAPESE